MAYFPASNCSKLCKAEYFLLLAYNRNENYFHSLRSLPPNVINASIAPSVYATVSLLDVRPRRSQVNTLNNKHNTHGVTYLPTYSLLLKRHVVLSYV
jgi:hypothetical protein